MSDELDDQYEEPSALRRQLEEQAQRAAEAQAKLAALERKDAFRDAGLDPANKQHQAFIKAYDGDVTPEAVAEYVTDLGIERHPSAQVIPMSIPQEERDAVARITEASTGDGQPPPETDREKEIRSEMELAARRQDNARLDALASELTRVRGYRTLNDLNPT